MITKLQILALRLIPVVVLFFAHTLPASAAAPGAPTNLAGTGPVQTQIALNWTAVSGATSYNIYRSLTSGNESQLTTGVLGNTFEDSNLTNGTTYFYKVTAVNGSGESSKSSEISVLSQSPGPSTFTAAAGDSQVVLNWSSALAATSYKIYRDSLGAPVGSTTIVVTGTTYTDTGLVNGTTYYYQIASINSSGENPQTGNAISATPHAANGSEAPAGAPPGVTAVAGNANIILRWLPLSNAATYDVFRGTSSGTETLLKNVSATTFTDTGLSNGTALFYKVRGVNGAQTGPLSGEVSATPNLPPTPANVTATAASGEVVVNWTASGTSYAIYRGFTPGTETLLDSGLTGNTFTDVSVANGTTYFYKVQGLNSGGSSALSAEVSASPSGPAPQSWSGTISFGLAGEPVQSCNVSIPDINRPVLAAFMQAEGSNMQAIATKYNAISFSIDGFTQYNFGTPGNVIHLASVDDPGDAVCLMDYRWPHLGAQRILKALAAAATAANHPEIANTGLVLYGFSVSTDHIDTTVADPLLTNRILAIVQQSEIDEDRYNPVSNIDIAPHILLASGLTDGASSLNQNLGDFGSSPVPVTIDALSRGLATHQGAPLTVINSAGFGHGGNPDNPFISIWLDSILSQRLPATLPVSSPVSLPSWQNTNSWVGTYTVSTSTSAPWGSSGSPGVQLINNLVSTRNAYTDSRLFTWLPSQNTASSWLTFSNTGNTSALTRVITSPLTAAGKVGAAFGYQISATNSPTSYNAVGTMPAGLSLNSTTGAITGTPTATGSKTLTISANNTQGTGSTVTLTITVSANTTSTTTFSQWETLMGITGLPTAMPFNDGVPNLLKYLFDINPKNPLTAAGRALLPAVTTLTSSGVDYLTITYREYAAMTGVTATVQTCSDLKSWANVVTPDFFQQTTDPSTGDQIITVGVKINGSPFQFLRLNVQM